MCPPVAGGAGGAMSTEVGQIHCAVQSGSLASSVKRVVDIVVSSLLLAALAPVIVVIIAVLKATESGPVFFEWNIVGAGGRPVRSYKFRTMVKAAETMEVHLRQQGQNEMKSV